MAKQFVVTVLAGVAAWWAIQQLKALQSGGGANDLASAIGMNEAQSETYV
ncbi:hypothetical protein SAMN05216224_108139 [Thioclava dalianensis]|nr:hypothetical protein [Thioclava dalianensis]SFN65109.1 hypothetical protein SAMN05216224_108139 [Thioclava dalianensis]